MLYRYWYNLNDNWFLPSFLISSLFAEVSHCSTWFAITSEWSISICNALISVCSLLSFPFRQVTTCPSTTPIKISLPSTFVFWCYSFLIPRSPSLMLRLFSKCHRSVAIGSYFFTFFLNSATNIHYFFIINCIEIKLSYEYLQKSVKSLKISFLNPN